jgi:type VI secretion system protein ImpJ
MKPRKPLWIDGLFLEPQHLQRQDRYHERLLARRLGAVVPNDWGVLDLEIDARALQAGEVRVVRLEAILPDGTPLSVDDANGDVLPPRRFEGFGAFGGAGGANAHRPLDVYVALAQESDQVANVDLKNDPATTARYLRSKSTVADVNTGTEERSVDWARLNLRILFGEERLERFDVLRVGQLARATSGAVTLREQFVPPVLHIAASTFVTNGFRRVLRAMIGKQQGLASSRRQRSATVVEFQAGDAAKFWLLHTLNGMLPAVAEVVDKPTTSAREAYGVLAQLIGQLCTFDVEGDPMEIPRFNYLELGEVFEPMFVTAIDLLERVIAERYVQIPLESREGVLVGELRDSSIFQHAFYLAVSGNYSEAQVREHVPKLTKISSLQQIGLLLHSHVNGARLAVEHRPPGALPIKPGITFFRLETAGDFWTQMIATGTIAIHAPFDPGALQVALYAVDPTTLQ